MAKFDLSCEFTGLHGKLSSTSDDYFTTNKQTGTVTRCHRVHREYTPNEDQKAAQQQFAARTKAVSAWYRDPSNADALAEYRKRYRAQHKIGSLFAYLVKYLDLDATPGSNTPTTSTPGTDTNTPPPGTLD